MRTHAQYEAAIEEVEEEKKRELEALQKEKEQEKVKLQQVHKEKLAQVYL
jgi:hypothetical protein